MYRPVLFALFVLVQPLAAAPMVCPNGTVTTETDDAALHQRICGASDDAIALFAECGFALPEPVSITTYSDIDRNCFGVFHCGEARIELLEPDRMTALRDADSVFADIPTERFFDSVVVHELAHALYDQTDCPYPNCLASSEYFAYSYQIMSLSDADRAALEQGLDMERRISRDYIVGILAVMSPDAFTRRVWTHFSQRDDQCAWLGGILSGAIVFDHDYP
ncbi:hypothetical protein GQ651_03560 [Alphaproteobacteria bacterium GH1-50]|uniref:Uncharacterized protein n=1 Tax=Kangsaoukella pontilimi TaxID=2691042 RepID=A0A7C9MQ01_9RHOB|nr:hypothetical protein [Kangsaoukella pontilimi]MXQ06917.1 hypothetical protein [Kangsaoukella pontilimi]